MLVVSAPLDCEPLIDLLPDQPPEATQAVALVATHVRVDAPPLLTVLGVVEKLTVGAAAITETVADCVALPPAPLQVSMYVALAFNAPVDSEPLVGLLPDQAPEAVQVVALSAVQVTLELSPLVTVLGLALMLIVAVGFELTVTVADCAALPPSPLQVSV